MHRLGRVLRLVLFELVEPGVPQLLAALADALLEVLVDAVGDTELLGGAAVELLGRLNLVPAQRLAVRRVMAFLARHAPGDVAVHDDQRRPVGRALERLQRPLEHVDIIGVGHADNVPAVAEEARGHIFGEGDVGVAFDGDVVVVVDPAKVVQLQVAGQRGGLAGDALHHAAVASQAVDVIVEHLEIGLVVMGGQPLAGHRHADGGGDAIAQRAGRRLNAGRPAIFRVAGAAAIDLAEALDVVQRHGRPIDLLVLGVDSLDLGQV